METQFYLMQQIQNGFYDEAAEQSELRIWMGMDIVSMQHLFIDIRDIFFSFSFFLFME